MRLSSIPRALMALTVAAALIPEPATAQPAQLDEWKAQLVETIEGRRTFTANVVDQIFSYAELGFQEFETSRYLVDLLREEGFTVEEGVAGIPTAWVATVTMFCPEASPVVIWIST